MGQVTTMIGQRTVLSDKCSESYEVLRLTRWTVTQIGILWTHVEKC